MSELPVVIVLAAGRGERFAASGGGVHKLDALLAGQRVIDHVMQSVRASGLTYHLVRPDDVAGAGRTAGMGDSIAAGVRATSGATGWLILPADLPLIRADTLRRVALAVATRSRVMLPVYQGRRGHPVGFPAACGPDLLDLQGNHGAARVVRAQEAMNLVAVLELDDVGVVTDVDTLDDLRQAEILLAERGDSDSAST